MAHKVEVWKSEDGKDYPDEITALKADAAYWNKRYNDTANELATYKAREARRAANEPQSSYGSSGGGGHD